MHDYLHWQPGSSECHSGCQNISNGTTVPKGFEWYLYQAYSGAELGPWTCWGTRKWNHRQGCKRWLCLIVCWTWAVLGVSRQNIRRKQKAGSITSIWQGGKTLLLLWHRFENWYWALIWLPRPGSCPLTRYSTGSLQAITAWENIFT